MSTVEGEYGWGEMDREVHSTDSRGPEEERGRERERDKRMEREREGGIKDFPCVSIHSVRPPPPHLPLQRWRDEAAGSQHQLTCEENLPSLSTPLLPPARLLLPSVMLQDDGGWWRALPQHV